MRLALLSLLLASSAWGQAPEAEPTRRLVWWGDVSGGFDAEPFLFGAGVHVSAGRRAAVRVGFDAGDEFTLSAPPTSIRAVSLSGGVRARRGRVHAAAFVGPSVVWGLDRFDGRRTGPSRERYTTLGAAYSGDAFVEVGRGFGLGLSLTGNVNPEVSQIGVRLGVHAKLSRGR